MFPQGLIAPRSRSEIRETNEAYVLSADVPGTPSENVEIEVSGNILSFRAEHGNSKEGEGRSRRTYQSFQQSLALPSTVDPDQIEAHCENGVLEVMRKKKR